MFIAVGTKIEIIPLRICEDYKTKITDPL